MSTDIKAALGATILLLATLIVFVFTMTQTPATFAAFAAASSAVIYEAGTLGAVTF